MRKLIFAFAFFVSVSLYAQSAAQAVKAVPVTDVSFPKDQPVDVRLLHPDLDKDTEEYLKAHPEGLLQNKLAKPSWTFTVGSTYTWYAADLTNSNNPYQVPATCRAVGTHCYIFVEDANWNVRVTQAQVNAIENAFDNSTPANASKGIYQTDVDTFGNPPDVDGDPKIIILILDIKDGYTPGNSYTAGYFFSRDQTNNTGSNHAEIYYLDCNPLDLTANLTMAMQTTAHEFQHMIQYNYQHGSEPTVFNEGCSLVAELINGYAFREQSSFANDTPQGLLVWRTGNDVLKDYSRAARFMLYYYNQFGTDFLKKFVQSSYAGITGIDDALSRLTISTSRRFADILPDWYLANSIDNTAFNPKWGYTLVTGMPKPQGSVYYSANVNNYSANVPYMGAQIITHKGSLSLSSTFGAGNATYHKIKAIKFGSGNPVVEDVPLNSTYSVPSLSGTYSSVQYLILNSSITTDYPIQYSSTGTNPVSYEFGYNINPSVGSFNWSAGDTVAVYFDAVNLGKIDSLKIQFSKTGSITGGIWEYTGVQNPSPLGRKLLTNMVANPTIISSPITEWTKIDLRTYNISSSKQFAVAFPVVLNNPKVLVSEYPGTSPYHSYTYLIAADASSGTANWYYITKDASTIYIYSIKAYISVGTVGNEKIVELLPSSYSLSQNYPNPFNPSTKIKFALPEAAKVSVIIYDMLGREIKTLINSDQTAGSHELTWNGDNNMGQKVASGIYMYAISTSKFVQTKKMVLLK